MKGLFVIVVTFNRRALLRDCLVSLAQQTLAPEAILVINNASTDGTAADLDLWMAEQPDQRKVWHLPTNTGGSGGFTRGIKEACALGGQYLWVMDDDSQPSRDCLEKLVVTARADDTIGFVAPMVRWSDGKPCLSNATQADPARWADEFEVGHPLVRIVSATFVGLLLSRKAIERVGLPVPQFFIWYDDIEYTLRISKHMRGLCIPTAVVTHLVPENAVPDFSRVNAKNVWKHKFGIRNETAVTFRTRRFGLMRCLLLWRQRANEMRKGNVESGLRWSVLLAGFKGLFFNYSLWIEKI